MFNSPQRSPSTPETLRENYAFLGRKFAWKVFHILLGNNSSSLWKTAEYYLDNTHTQVSIDDQSKHMISEFKRLGRGLILTNHPSGNFGDIFPTFRELGDGILRKSDIFTLEHTLPHHRREFPDYHFGVTNGESYKALKKVIEGREKVIKKQEDAPGYIFLVPAIADRTFGSFGQKLIQGLPDDFPLLICHVEHSEPIGYAKMIAARISQKELTRTTLQAKIDAISDWKDLSRKEMDRKMRSVFTEPMSQG